MMQIKPPDGLKQLRPGETDKDSDQSAALDLQHNKESYEREKKAFSVAKWVIIILFIAGSIISYIVINAVSKGANSWLITLATIWLLTPTFLLACLLRHIYQKSSTDINDIKDIPAVSLLTQILEIISKFKSVT